MYIILFSPSYKSNWVKIQVDMLLRNLRVIEVFLKLRKNLTELSFNGSVLIPTRLLYIRLQNLLLDSFTTYYRL